MPRPTPNIGLYQPYPHTFGGVQSTVIKLAAALPALGYNPIVISPESGSFTALLQDRMIPTLISDPGPHWHVYGRGHQGLSYILSPSRLLSLIRYWFKLRSDLKRHQISLLHCNDYRAVLLAAPAARLARIPVIWHMHGFIHSPLANLIAATLVKWTVPVSAGMLDYLPLPRWAFGKYEVINNGSDPLPSPSPTHQHPPRNDGGLPDQTTATEPAPVVLAVGALHPRKGYETLINAFKLVLTHHPTAECWIVGGEFGDGSYAAQLRQQTRELHLESAIRFIGHSDDVPALMERCQLLAVPSQIEAFGMVAIEAMLAGKPVVACRTGGLAEIVDPPRTGHLVAPGDAPALARSIIELLTNPSLARQMGEAGRRRALDRFSLNRMSTAFASFYGTLLHPA